MKLYLQIYIFSLIFKIFSIILYNIILIVNNRITVTYVEKYKALIAERKEKEKVRKKEKKKREKAKIREKKKLINYKKRLKKQRDKYKPIHVKRLRHLQNQRYYKKKQAEILAEKQQNGDRYGYHRIVLTKDYESYKELSHSWWLLTAVKKFNKYIEENNTGVLCEKRIIQSDVKDAYPVKYEILLLEKIDPKMGSNVRELRNEDGKFIENVVANNNSYAIIQKADWYIPETYHVYGYNPKTDRKTGRWIFDNIVNVNCSRDNIKNIFMCDNKLIIQYGTDFDFVICKNRDECVRLYTAFEHEVDPNNKFIIFSNHIAKSRKSWLYDQMEEKTGWDRKKIKFTKN